MPLSEIVDVQITRETQTVSQAGFGTLLILGENKAFDERIKFYSSLAEVGQDFNSADPEYIAAQDAFSQSPRPTRLAIGRRGVDNSVVEVQTAQAPFNYTTTINGTDVTIASLPTVQESTVVLDADLITGNYVGVTLNSVAIDTVNTVVTFDSDFVTSNSIVATVNGTPLSAVPFNTSHAQTLTDLATAIQGDASVTTATVTDTREITIVFAAVGASTLDSVVTTGGASQPTATIYDGVFLFDTNHLTTMNNIATAIQADSAIDSVSVGGASNRTLTVFAEPNQNGIINAFAINGGASQAGETITNNTQAVSKLTIADTMVTAINAAALGVTATDNGDGTYDLDADVPGTPYTLEVSTNIVNPNSAKIVITQVEPETEYTVTLNGVDVTYTSEEDVQDNETIATALTALVNASGLGITATDNSDGTFDVDDGSAFSLSVTDEIMAEEYGLRVETLTASSTITDDLDAIENENNDWYALACITRVKADIQLVAAWVETRNKIFGTASDDANIIGQAAGTDTTSIAALLNQSGYTRSFVMYHQDADSEYPECAWFGKTLPTTPGSITWKFKTLAGVSYSNLTTTQSTNALNKKCNIYQFIGGVGITQNGTMASGEYIDIIRGIDWLTARIQEYVYSLLVNSPKVPYTDAGIASVEAEIRRALDQGVSNNFIAEDPQYTVTVPTAASVSPANKAARLLQDVSFNATLSGAVHILEISGTVTV